VIISIVKYNIYTNDISLVNCECFGRKSDEKQQNFHGMFCKWTREENILQVYATGYKESFSLCVAVWSILN